MRHNTLPWVEPKPLVVPGPCATAAVAAVVVHCLPYQLGRARTCHHATGAHADTTAVVAPYHAAAAAHPARHICCASSTLVDVATAAASAAAPPAGLHVLLLRFFFLRFCVSMFKETQFHLLCNKNSYLPPTNPRGGGGPPAFDVVPPSHPLVLP